MAPVGGTELGAVCEELDLLLLQLLEALELLQAKRERLNRLVEQGWFSLSKTRYAVGNKSVSSLQYGHEMAPLVQVQTSLGEKGRVEFLVLPGDADITREETMESPAVEEIGPREQGIRRRKAPVKAEAPSPSQDAGPGPRAGSPQPDPLNWFGILVPQSLRQAQSSFKEGILLVGAVASLQSEIETGRRQYRALLERKRLLLARAAEPPTVGMDGSIAL